MTIQEIIALLQQQAASPSGGGGSAAPGASVSKAAGPTGSAGLALAGNGIGALLGLPPGVGGALGSAATNLGSKGNAPGTNMPSFLDPFGVSSIENNLGIPNISDLFGVPREAKSGAIGSALSSSGNPLDAIIGQFVNKGVGEGHVLSESGGSTFENSIGRLSAMLEALSGQRISPVTGTGNNFQNNPSFTGPNFGKSIGEFALPAGDQFISDPNQLSQVAQIIEKMQGMQSGGIGQAGPEWQKVLNQLTSQGLLQKYQGPMGAPGGGVPGTSGVPNVALPHPLAQNSPTQFAQAPYPV